MAVALPPLPPRPPTLPTAAGTAPAAPATQDRSGKEARGKIVAGLGLEMMRIAIPLLGNTPLGQRVAEVVAKLGREIAKPPQDLGQSELKFMGSQLYPGGPGPAPQGPPPAMPGPPPVPPAPPMTGT